MNFRPRCNPKPADAKQVFQYAIFLLARREYSVAELQKKFAGRFLSAPEIFAATFAKLHKLGLQSDRSFAENFVRSHAGWGSRKLRVELSRRGIENDLIAAQLPSAEAEVQRCAAVLTAKLGGKSLPVEYLAKQKLAAFLARRGFDLDVIRGMLSL